MPLQRRLPKRGFFNRFGKDYATVNLGKLQGRFEAGAQIDAEILKEAGVIARVGRDGLKVLGGGGDFDTKLIVRAAKFTASAAERIKAAGGTAEVV
jgi:large subunit ribosomal protein L15